MNGYPSYAEPIGVAFGLLVLGAIGAVLAMLDRLIGLPILGMVVLIGGAGFLLPTTRLQGEQAVVAMGIALIWSCVLVGYGGWRFVVQRRFR